MELDYEAGMSYVALLNAFDEFAGHMNRCGEVRMLDGVVAAKKVLMLASVGLIEVTIEAAEEGGGDAPGA